MSTMTTLADSDVASYLRDRLKSRTRANIWKRIARSLRRFFKR